MKQWICSLLVILLMFSFCSCGKQNANDITVTAPSEDITPAPIPSETPVQSQTDIADSAEASGIDVDLTALSSTMVYSEVYNMIVLPENYIGKTVKMNGTFTLYQGLDENGAPIPGQIYFACIIADATACCSQGLEFVLSGEHIYPDDYPELGAEITVVGTFQTYEENGYLYCHLIDAELE